MYKGTQEALGNLVDPEAISGIRLLRPPIVEKMDIPKFILCQNFAREWERRERARERYNLRLGTLQDRVSQSERDIEDMKKALRRVEPGSPPSEPWGEKTPEKIADYNKRVTEYNDHLQQARRLQERINDAIDKHRDIVERHNDAVREAEERLEELAEQALLLIDDDIVAVLDKATQIAMKFADSEKLEDLMVAVETCFIELKIFNSFEEHIDGNTARRDAQERISEVNALCARLLKNKEIHSHFWSVFQLIRISIEKNADLYDQVGKLTEGVDQSTLDEMTESFRPIFAKEFKTDFQYEGIIDPSELDNVVTEMHNTLDALKAHIFKVTELCDSTQEIAEAAVNIHQDMESTLATMRTNEEDVIRHVIFLSHFFCEMLDEEVIEDFYHRDLRVSVIALRESIINTVGEEQFNTIVTEAEDRFSSNTEASYETDCFSTRKTGAAIEAADCLRLQVERDQVTGYVNKLSTHIKNIEAHVEDAKEVPKRNADGFRSSVYLLYSMSCFPVLGFVFALVIYSKIKKFAPAFKSPLEVYHRLGTETKKKNKTMQTVALALGVVLGLGGMGIFFSTEIGTEIATRMSISSIIAVNVGFPGVVLVLYLITWAILSMTGRTLQSYIGIAKDAS